MKILYGPSVNLTDITPNATTKIAQYARICYQSHGDNDEALVKMLIKNGHTSQLEHAYASFIIVCDRGVTHEFVRHRIASYSQESTRFCRYKNGITVIQPPGLGSLAKRQWLKSMKESEKQYLNLLKRVSPQIARSVLPTCLKTMIGVTMNYRNWRWFLALRSAPNAHPQIQEIAHTIHKILNHYDPVIFETLPNTRES